MDLIIYTLWTLINYVCNMYMYLCLKGPDENQQMLIGLPFLKM